MVQPRCWRNFSRFKRWAINSFVGAHIHPHKAGMGDQRAGNAQVNLGRAGFEQQAYQRAGRIAAHDTVVDHHHPFAAHSSLRTLNFNATPCWRSDSVGWMNVRPI